ncbi:hypothetical protein [Methylobacterium isbiliense]|uniref:hypothetical protein n=1 Tax=Methylobacterium isbiliense TaxID=315478 RepID=UPI0025B2B0A5|nr:hypothetical protein [Methylobacterium isbiliense]MDN3626909.1 hypothetical protein [Methylobacterium isbiliense]
MATIRLGREAAALAGLAEVETETAALLARTGGRCPACGGPAGAGALLDGHRHGPAHPEAA